MKSIVKIILPVMLLTLLSACSSGPKSEFFVFLNTNPDREELPEAEVEALQEKHLANMDRLAAEGELVASGPFEGGGGMMILLAGNEEEAWEMVNSDPAVQAKRFRVEVLPVSFVKGGICPWWQPVDMGTYGFFRFRPGPNKNQELLQEHQYNLSVLEQEVAVLVTADFGDDGSGFLLIEGPLNDDWIEKVVDNQAIQEGAIELDIKNLWIARGTFCN